MGRGGPGRGTRRRQSLRVRGGSAAERGAAEQTPGGQTGQRRTQLGGRRDGGGGDGGRAGGLVAAYVTTCLPVGIWISAPGAETSQMTSDVLQFSLSTFAWIIQINTDTYAKQSKQVCASDLLMCSIIVFILVFWMNFTSQWMDLYRLFILIYLYIYFFLTMLTYFIMKHHLTASVT